MGASKFTLLDCRERCSLNGKGANREECDWTVHRGRWFSSARVIWHPSLFDSNFLFVGKPEPIHEPDAAAFAATLKTAEGK